MKAKYILMALGSIVGLWSVAALIGGIVSAGGIGALAGQYMTAIGLVTPIHTLVDFYTHIKGIEYLICVAFFVAFPIFFKYVNNAKEPKTITA